MDFWQWYVRRGRIDRSTWWLQYALPIGVLSVLALMADVALGNSSLESIATGETGYGPIVTTIGLLAAPASVSSGATRLHDRGMSAWWLLIGLVPLFGQVALLVITAGSHSRPSSPNPSEERRSARAARYSDCIDARSAAWSRAARP